MLAKLLRFTPILIQLVVKLADFDGFVAPGIDA